MINWIVIKHDKPIWAGWLKDDSTRNVSSPSKKSWSASNRARWEREPHWDLLGHLLAPKAPAVWITEARFLCISNVFGMYFQKHQPYFRVAWQKHTQGHPGTPSLWGATKTGSAGPSRCFLSRFGISRSGFFWGICGVCRLDPYVDHRWSSTRSVSPSRRPCQWDPWPVILGRGAFTSRSRTTSSPHGTAGLPSIHWNGWQTVEKTHMERAKLGKSWDFRSWSFQLKAMIPSGKLT